jgi:hypothetical protein
VRSGFIYLLIDDGCFKIVMSAGTQPYSCCSNGIVDIACICSLM